MFRPKILTTLKEYSFGQFTADAAAGIIVGIVAIPLAIAFAIASGLSPEKGLVTAIIAGFLISALGGSRVQIGGPTGAFVVVVYGVVHKYGVDGLIIATFLAGILLILMGLAKFGAIIKFIPRSVVVGFTSGIAVIIFSSQAKDFLGLSIEKVPVEFIEKWKEIFRTIHTANPQALILAIITILLVALWPRISRKIPGPFVALLVTSFVAAYFHWPVETIGTRFGELPRMLPKPHFFSIPLSEIQNLFQPAFTIAILGAVESLLSAVVADGMIGSRHRSNTELIAQGLANMASALFGGMPATGALARTVTNIKNGGRTPIAGIMHALTVFLVMIFFAPWVKLIPLACLAGILTVVAYHMSEWRSFKELLRSSRGEVTVLVATFMITILVDLSAAIQVGVVLSGFLFMKRMSEIQNIKLVTAETDDAENSESPLMDYFVPKGVEVYEVNGPLFFGGAHQFEEVDRAIGKKPKVRILRFRNVPMMDATGLHALKSFYLKCRKRNIHLLVTGLHVQPLNEMVKSDLYDMIGEEHVFGNMKEALNYAQTLL